MQPEVKETHMNKLSTVDEQQIKQGEDTIR